MKTISICKPTALLCSRLNLLLDTPFVHKSRPYVRACAFLVALVISPLFAFSYSVEGDWNATLERLHYVAPPFFFVPLLLSVRLGKAGPPRAEGLLLDAAIVLLAASRMWISAIPFSGHMLLFTYAALTERTWWHRAIIALFIVHTTWFKLIVWGDFLTWSVGIAGGLIAARFYPKEPLGD